MCSQSRQQHVPVLPSPPNPCKQHLPACKVGLRLKQMAATTPIPPFFAFSIASPCRGLKGAASLLQIMICKTAIFAMSGCCRLWCSWHCWLLPKASWELQSVILLPHSSGLYLVVQVATDLEVVPFSCSKGWSWDGAAWVCPGESGELLLRHEGGWTSQCRTAGAPQVQAVPPSLSSAQNLTFRAAFLMPGFCLNPKARCRNSAFDFLLSAEILAWDFWDVLSVISWRSCPFKRTDKIIAASFSADPAAGALLSEVFPAGLRGTPKIMPGFRSVHWGWRSRRVLKSWVCSSRITGLRASLNCQRFLKPWICAFSGVGS